MHGLLQLLLLLLRQGRVGQLVVRVGLGVGHGGNVRAEVHGGGRGLGHLLPPQRRQEAAAAAAAVQGVAVHVDGVAAAGHRGRARAAHGVGGGGAGVVGVVEAGVPLVGGHRQAVALEGGAAGVALLAVLQQQDGQDDQHQHPARRDPHVQRQVAGRRRLAAVGVAQVTSCTQTHTHTHMAYTYVIYEVSNLVFYTQSTHV